MEQTAETKYAYAFSRCRPEHGRCDEFSLRHPKMPLGQRAKIFSPFSALRGFEEAIDEKRELYVEREEPSEEDQEKTNLLLSRLSELTRNRRMARENRVYASVRFFVPCADENHEAYGRRGSYVTLRGPVWKIDPVVRGTLTLGDREIALADIAGIKIDDRGEED